MATYPVVSRGVGRKPPSEIRVEGDIAIVSLSRGLEATIDKSDIEIVAGYRWSTLINSRTGHAYAVRYEKQKCFLMHRVLLGAPGHLHVDHADGDGLNNRRSNIRLATQSQNMANSVLVRRNKLGVRGVRKKKGKFRAEISHDNKTVHLGYYDTAEEASAAYKGAAKLLWGEFAQN